jgi:predicted ATPase/DNA-binding SARP family transcriptional activator
VRYGILGVTQAYGDDGAAIPLGGARLRALLAALALRPGRPVAVGALVADVWADDPPQEPVGALQALVGRLRRALGPAAVGSGERGYWLCASADDVDLGRFERLAAQGARALAAGDPATAARTLREALALWRGPALADLPDATGARARYEALHLEVLRRRLTADVELGHAADVLPELAGLCAEHPLHEPLRALQIRALHATGRTADALTAYARTHHDLATRLGTDPGPELRTLHTELLRATTPSPERTAPGPGPGGKAGASGGVRGSGGAADGPGSAGEIRPDPEPGEAASAAPTGAVGGAWESGGPARASSPDPRTRSPSPSGPPAGAAGRQSAAGGPGLPAASLGQPGGRLRSRLTSFVGRERELRALREELAGARLVTLTGPGGSGKTRLSQEAAALLAPGWPDGVWLAELAPIDAPQDVPGAVLNAVGARDTVLQLSADGQRDDPALKLVEHCGPRRMLLVLDNCEHLVQASADLAELLLTSCPGVTVLATSREPLGVPGELVRPVDPLPDQAALRLLAERGAAARPGFTVEDDPDACAEICHRLDGLPLAIELAAARLRSLTPRQIADRLDDRFRLLTRGSRTVLPRQQTLRAVVDWSWDLLGTRERALLQRLSVFTGGWTLEAAEQVCQGGPLAAQDVADVLGSLVDKSLVVADMPGPEARYRMLETIHEYAAGRLHASGRQPEAVGRHITYFRELVRAADPGLRGAGQVRWLERLETEHDNVRTALRRAIEAKDEPEALLLALGMSWFWTLRDYRTEARDWYTAVAALGPDPFAAPRPPVEPLSVGALEAGLPLTPELLHDARRGVRLHQLAARLGEWAMFSPAAVELGEAVLEAYPPHLPQSCRLPGVLRGYALFLAQRFEELPRHMDELVDGCRAFGREWELAFALQIRSKVTNEQPEFVDRATTDADESLALFTRLGDRWGMAEALAGQAETASWRGDHALAARGYERAMELAREIGAHGELAMLQMRLGEALTSAGLVEEGERYLLAGIDLADTDKPADQGALIFGHMVLVASLGRRGEFERARELLGGLMREVAAQQQGFPTLGMLTCIQGWLEARAGAPEEGLRLLREGLRSIAGGPLPEVVSVRLLTMQLPLGADILTRLAPDGASQAAEHAATVLGAYDALHGRISTIDREELATVETRLRTLLGDAAYESHHTRGTTLTAPQAATLLHA